jgi:hypothetical protein
VATGRVYIDLWEVLRRLVAHMSGACTVSVLAFTREIGPGALGWGHELGESCWNELGHCN